MPDERARDDGVPVSRDEVQRLTRLVVGLGVALVGVTAWFSFKPVSLPPVLSVERLEIVEPDGKLAFVFANSQRPAGGTMDGKTIMEGQEAERRGVPSIIFFDGKGDEVGGVLTGVRTSDNGYSAVRHLSLDGYKQDQTVVLAHYQSPEGSTAGLHVNDRPQDVSLLDALDSLGLSSGASRADLQTAIAGVPETERAGRLRALFGVERLFLGSTRTRNASLVMKDGQGRPRIVIEVPDDGEPSIQVLNAAGDVVMRLPS